MENGSENRTHGNDDKPISPAELVKASRLESAKFNRYFTWDNKRAADLHRQWEERRG